MSFSRAIQWYHSHADPIWPDGTFNECLLSQKADPTNCAQHTGHPAEPGLYRQHPVGSLQYL